MACYTYGKGRNLQVIVWIRGTKVNSYYTYYTASIWFTVFAMVIMLVAVGINPAMDESRRRVTRLLFVTIILSSLCEWTGNMLDNAPVQLIWLHRLVKLVELSVAPYIGLICGIVLLLVTAFLFGGIALSQIRDDVEITWLTVGMASMMLYKFYSDILQQVDGLTELGNRWGYVERADAAMYRVKNEKKAAARS